METKVIHTYWEREEFQYTGPNQGRYIDKKFVDYVIPANYTAQDIEDFCKRKDVILIK